MRRFMISIIRVGVLRYVKNTYLTLYMFWNSGEELRGLLIVVNVTDQRLRMMTE